MFSCQQSSKKIRKNVVGVSILSFFSLESKPFCEKDLLGKVQKCQVRAEECLTEVCSVFWLLLSFTCYIKQAKLKESFGLAT